MKEIDALAFTAIAFTLLVSGGAGCNGKSGAPAANDPRQAQIAHGRAIYQSTCIACHNADPHKPGALGPEISGSSEALIEARVLHQSYPEGYTPKRPTHAMPAMPQFKNDIPALYAYLASPS